MINFKNDPDYFLQAWERARDAVERHRIEGQVSGGQPSEWIRMYGSLVVRRNRLWLHLDEETTPYT
jgi:hypothetical protein